MTWHLVQFPVSGRSLNESWNKMQEARTWCAHNLSSNGVLWKHEQVVDWSVFMFAQPEDLIVFKIKFGC